MKHLNYTDRVAGKVDPHLRFLLTNPSSIRNFRRQRNVRVIVEYAENLNRQHLCHQPLFGASNGAFKTNASIYHLRMNRFAQGSGILNVRPVMSR